jgi:hypothetical protein
MEHFYSDIQGWFENELFYDYIVKALPEKDAHIVEVGAWKGKSTSYLIVNAINIGKNIKIDVVDTWMGSDEDIHKTDSDISKLFDVFTENLKSVENYYTPIRLNSIEASKLYQDYSLDFVFIDASHKKEDVIDDINHWLPKLKIGGVLAGDDLPWQSVRDAVKETLNEFYEFEKGIVWYYVKN